MIFEVKCDELTYLLTYEELTDRTHTRIVSFIVLDRHRAERMILISATFIQHSFPLISSLQRNCSPFI